MSRPTAKDAPGARRRLRPTAPRVPSRACPQTEAQKETAGALPGEAPAVDGSRSGGASAARAPAAQREHGAEQQDQRAGGAVAAGGAAAGDVGAVVAVTVAVATAGAGAAAADG